MDTDIQASLVEVEPFESGASNAAMVTDSSEFECFIAQGTASRKAGNHGGALYFFMKAAELKPAHNIVRLEMARSLVDLQRLNEADGIYRNILAITPDCTAALMGVAYLERKRGNHDRSGKWFEMAAIAAPEDLDLQAELAGELHALSQYERSELLYCKILEKDPFHFGGLMGLGAAFRRRGRRSEALSIFADLLSAHPGSITLRHEMARAQIDLRMFDGARESYRHILALKPDDQSALSGLSRLTEAIYLRAAS